MVPGMQLMLNKILICLFPGSQVDKIKIHCFGSPLPVFFTDRSPSRKRGSTADMVVGPPSLPPNLGGLAQSREECRLGWLQALRSQTS